MNPHQPQNLILNVPYFQQTRHATCGPAALMMILKYYDPTYTLTQTTETHLWRQSRSRLLFGATLQYRLATLAKKQGYISEIYQQTKTKSIRENFLSQPAKKAQIPITYTPDITMILSTALQKKIPPLILLNLHPIIGENVYHWVVVTGKDTHYIFVNDPYIPKHQKITEKKDVPITHNTFHQAVNYPQTGIFHFPSAAILIHK